MGKPFHVVIVGAGPAGLSAALSLVQKSDAESPIHVTLLELRDKLQTLGGAINLTPLALRYLDSLCVAERLRPLGSGVSAIEIVAHRTGRLLGRLWAGFDAIRVQRQLLVESMMETLKEVPGERCKVVFGARIQMIEETGPADGEGSVRVVYKISGDENNSNNGINTLEADMLLGCDGLHSQVRSQLVDPSRRKTYSGKCVAYGYTCPTTPDEKAHWLRADNQPLVTDTTLVSKGNDSLLMTYDRPAHDVLYLAAVMPLADKSGSSDSGSGEGWKRGEEEGWAVHGADKAGLKRDVARTYEGGGIACLGDVVEKCEEWFFYPVYMLPSGGAWVKGRALLLGDAAHGMPPQGESTGIAIEDGLLVAHVLARRTSRTIPQLLDDYECLRRTDIDATYSETMARWESHVPAAGGVGGVVMEWMTWAYLKFMSYRGGYFDRDVRELVLPD